MQATAKHDLPGPLSPLDWHVLVALDARDLHGYGIMKAVRADSGGTVPLELGSLYRLISRLMTAGLIDEVDAPADAPSGTRGQPRRYYRLTPLGRTALRQESLRLRDALALARRRRLVPKA